MQQSQILAHLVSNALDAASAGGNVWISAEQLENEVEIVVVDDGIGMTQAQQSHLFKPFYSTKETWGMGLGSISRKRLLNVIMDDL
jgi:signal transduction histidine kinase